MKKTLIVILGLSLLLLAVSLGTAAIANNNAQREHIWLMETLLPGGKDFKKVAYSGDDTTIRSIHQASEGFVIETVTQGYADEIVMYIGVDNDGNVTGLVAYKTHETLGLGSKILYDDAFLAQFLNKSGTFVIGLGEETDLSSSATSSGASSGEEIGIDGISGATVSSKAVVRCVNSAIAYVTGADVGSSATS